MIVAKTVEAILSDPTVIKLCPAEDPANVGKYVKPGDEVVLYGAYMMGCLGDAKDALEQIEGVTVRYGPNGCI